MSDVQEPSDGELVRRFRRGDAASWLRLVQRWQTRAESRIRKRVSSRENARDIVDAAFEVFARTVHQFDDERPFWPWFWNLLKWEACQARKVSRRERRKAAGLARIISQSYEPDPQLGLVLDELLAQVQTLPSPLRRVLELTFWEDLPDREIALSVGCGRSTVPLWRRKALAILRGRLEGRSSRRKVRFPCQIAQNHPIKGEGYRRRDCG